MSLRASCTVACICMGVYRALLQNLEALLSSLPAHRGVLVAVQHRHLRACSGIELLHQQCCQRCVSQADLAWP